jgi:hypothetical protein
VFGDRPVAMSSWSNTFVAWLPSALENVNVTEPSSPFSTFFGEQPLFTVMPALLYSAVRTSHISSSKQRRSFWPRMKKSTDEPKLLNMPPNSTPM